MAQPINHTPTLALSVGGIVQIYSPEVEAKFGGTIRKMSEYAPFLHVVQQHEINPRGIQIIDFVFLDRDISLYVEDGSGKSAYIPLERIQNEEIKKTVGFLCGINEEPDFKGPFGKEIPINPPPQSPTPIFLGPDSNGKSPASSNGGLASLEKTTSIPIDIMQTFSQLLQQNQELRAEISRLNNNTKQISAQKKEEEEEESKESEMESRMNPTQNNRYSTELSGLGPTRSDGILKTLPRIEYWEKTQEDSGIIDDSLTIWNWLRVEQFLQELSPTLSQNPSVTDTGPVIELSL